MGQQNDPNTSDRQNDGGDTESQPGTSAGGQQNQGIEDFGQGGREAASTGQQEGAWRPADADDGAGQNPMNQDEGSLGSTGGGSGSAVGETGDDAGENSDTGIGSAQGGA